MVMRNRHDGANAPQWWDDLPPEIKKRCANAAHLRDQDFELPDRQQHSSGNPLFSPVRIARDLSWLALIFVIIALADLLFLILALSFLHGNELFSQ
jgi:hypothetical protein